MSNDLIRRRDAIGACAYETIECYEARKAIRALPSADRPQGEWRGEHKMPDMPRYEWYRCSECNFLSQSVVNFCPNCGADMRGKQNE